ncbi:hypothetical protein ACTXKW_25825, partial [Pseudomonas helleri]
MLKRHVWHTFPTVPLATRQRWRESTVSFFLICALFPALSGCEKTEELATLEPGEKLSGGATSVAKTDSNAFSMPSTNLS